MPKPAFGLAQALPRGLVDSTAVLGSLLHRRRVPAAAARAARRKDVLLHAPLPGRGAVLAVCDLGAAAAAAARCLRAALVPPVCGVGGGATHQRHLQGGHLQRGTPQKVQHVGHALIHIALLSEVILNDMVQQ